MIPYFILTQHLDANGQPCHATFEQPVVYKSMPQPTPEAVRDFLTGMHPTRTGTHGTYHYEDEGRGSGTLTIHGVSEYNLARIDQMVHLLEIERTIGMTDPHRQADLPLYLLPFVISNRSPYINITLMIVFLLVGSVMISTALMLKFGLFTRICMPIMGAAMIALASWLAIRDVKRLRWWRRARAQALKDGGPIPEELHIWS